MHTTRGGFNDENLLHRAALFVGHNDNETYRLSSDAENDRPSLQKMQPIIFAYYYFHEMKPGEIQRPINRIGCRLYQQRAIDKPIIACRGLRLRALESGDP